MTDNQKLAACYAILALGCIIYLLGAPVWVIAASAIPGIVMFFIAYNRKVREYMAMIESFLPQK
jgi:hypothetical protein